MDAVRIERIGAVGYLVLNRPDSLNSVNMDLALGLVAGIEEMHADANIRAVVIRGAGKAFCAGGDLPSMAEGKTPGEVLRELVFHFNRAILGIRRIPKPVIACVNGAAAGAGMSLALACDLRIAAKGAKFRQAYTSNGLIPDGGWSVWVTAMVGLGRASELIFTDPLLDAQQALELGLVNRVVDQTELQQAVDSEAQRLAAGATKAYAHAKAILNRVALPHLEEHLENERQSMITVGSGPDALEGITAFLAKRRPVYTGA